ncbi:multidrug transporter [Thermococcus sp. 18S1]|uniref:multidrug transporter n=1 Tax=Thermococcus sp. 18S1 TaxID=1638210 RepID=UPI00143B7270|nr:multidrug transporter [Thermococcus sp. 18S1]NJE30419.1 multidrug transporter [Thermococcus sp. 18S1]
MVTKIRGYILVGVLLLVVLGVELVANAEGFLPSASYQRGYFGAGSLQAELLPAGSHVTGHVRAEHPFSVYIVTSESGYFENVTAGSVILRWENVTEVNLDLITSEGAQYLVVKNGNTEQEIEIAFRADR